MLGRTSTDEAQLEAGDVSVSVREKIDMSLRVSCSAYCLPVITKTDLYLPRGGVSGRVCKSNMVTHIDAVTRVACISALAQYTRGQGQQH